LIDQEDYIQAFTHFMRSGESGALSAFLVDDENTDFLKIYRNGFYKACLSALRANFISLTYLLDDTEFNQIATQYINLYPPVQATLVAYGMAQSLDADTQKNTLSFPSFLSKLIKIEIARDSAFIPFLNDIAILDQAWFSTLNKLNLNQVSLAQVQLMLEQGQDLSVIPFKLVDSVSLVSIEFDVFTHWQTLRFRGEKTETIPNQCIRYILFWQCNGEVQAKLLSSIESHFYQEFITTGSLSDAFESAAQKDDEFDVSALFADLLNASLLMLED